jgi:hypothetical protein
MLENLSVILMVVMLIDDLVDMMVVLTDLTMVA